VEITAAITMAIATVTAEDIVTAEKFLGGV